MLLRANNTITGLKEDGASIVAGETFSCEETEGARLIDLGAAEEVEEEDEGEDPGDDKAAILAHISAAQTLEQLGVLPVDETDQDIIAAYHKRLNEIDDPDH
jgi:hypothetical protein